MRVLLLTETSHIGGAEVMIRNLALELRARGDVVGLVAPSNGGDWLHHAMERDGFPVWQFALGGAINPGLVRCIRTAVAEFKPDVMHSHLWVMAAYGGFVALRTRVPHVITMHGDGEQTRYLRRRVALRLAFRGARAVVAVSDAMRDDVATSLGISPSRMKVVGNGSAFPGGNREATRATLGLDADAFVVICIGSQIVRKNHIVVLRALARATHIGNWRLVIAGPHGDASSAVTDEATSLGIADRVLNLGPRHDVPELLAASDLYIMPSLWEGMPVALVEAMGAGKPIVASRVGGIPDMIRDGVDGALLNDPNDAVELASILDRLYLDEQLRASMAASAHDRAVARYGVATMTDEYLALYKRTAAR